MFKFVYQQGWLSKVFLAFIAFSFIIGTAIMWGPGGLNFGFGNYVIRVGDITVTPKEFVLELNRLQILYENKLTKEQLKKAAINNLTITALFAYLAEKDGFWISKKEISDFIRNQFFQNGTFDVKKFEKYLQMLRLTPSEYEEIVKKTLLANKYKSAVFTTTYANDKTLKVILLPYTLKVKAEIVEVPLKVFEKNIKLNEKEIKNFYEKIKGNFYETIPSRVEIYLAKDEREAEAVYQSLKENNKENLKPLKVLTENQKPPKELEEIFYKTLKSKNISVVKTDRGFYIGAYYPEEKRKLPYEKVKEQVKELYLKYKIAEWVNKHKEELLEQVLKGELKGKAEVKELLGVALISNFGLNIKDLFKLMENKKPFGVVLADGFYVFKPINVEIIGNLGTDIEETYKIFVRKHQYLKKIQEILDYLTRTNEVPIEINQKLLQRI
jgi:hypothetical protein